MDKFSVNRKVKATMQELGKRPAEIADKARIRRDLFSRILGMKRPVYAAELVPICEALGVTVSELLKKPVA